MKIKTKLFETQKFPNIDTTKINNINWVKLRQRGYRELIVLIENMAKKLSLNQYTLNVRNKSVRAYRVRHRMIELDERVYLKKSSRRLVRARSPVWGWSDESKILLIILVLLCFKTSPSRCIELLRFDL